MFKLYLLFYHQHIMNIHLNDIIFLFIESYTYVQNM